MGLGQDDFGSHVKVLRKAPAPNGEIIAESTATCWHSIYSKSLQDHVTHLQQVFDLLKQNQLYVKLNKCSFAQPQIEYLGHVISGQGVATD